MRLYAVFVGPITELKLEGALNLVDGPQDSYWQWHDENKHELEAATLASVLRKTAQQPHVTTEMRELLGQHSGRDPAAIPSPEARLAALVEEISSPRPSTNRRIILAYLADLFFSTEVAAGSATKIDEFSGSTISSAKCVKDFIEWIAEQGEAPIHPPVQEVMRVLLAMQHAGLLIGAGYKQSEPLLGQVFWAVKEEDSRRRTSNLWLAEVFGGEVIIPAYNMATILIVGKDGDGKELTGSGLALGFYHVITNRHVVEMMETEIKVVVPELPPDAITPRATSGIVGPSVAIPIHKSQIRYSKRDPEDIDRARNDLDVDIALITLKMFTMAPTLEPLPVVTFRNPRWGDSAYVFGYPRVYRTTSGDDITVHTGKVVNPADDAQAVKVEFGEVVHPSTEIYDPPEKERVFLVSSIARPGTSGGPIVAADGRVVGIVVEHSAPAASSDVGKSSDDGRQTSAPFYFGIPSSEIVRTLRKWGELDGVLGLFVEDWT